MPAFLEGKTEAQAYEHWLARKASAHVRRDRNRGRAGDSVTRSLYKEAIHAAVVLSGGVDAYTGEPLDWHLISQYDNDESKLGRHKYKAQFALLPSVDHLDAGATEASFRICAWRTNDAKNDLSHGEFIALCRRVVAHAGESGEG